MLLKKVRIFMSAQPQAYQQQRMTLEEFLAFEEAHPDEKYELDDGYLRNLGALLMAGGSNDHATITFNVGIALGIALRASGGKCRPYAEGASFRVNAKTTYHPDCSISCDERDLARNDAIEHPSLVVEVLSPSTEAFDRGRKFLMYSECLSIQEYMLVNTTQQLVEVFHRLPDGRMVHQIYREGETITLNGVGLSISVIDCYYGIFFE